jgi:hypothetical protein
MSELYLIFDGSEETVSNHPLMVDGTITRIRPGASAAGIESLPVGQLYRLVPVNPPYSDAARDLRSVPQTNVLCTESAHRMAPLGIDCGGCDATGD